MNRSTDLQHQNRTYHEAQSSMELLANYYAWTYGRFNKYIRGDVVELGCGSGMGIATYLDHVTSVVAVDHNEELLRRVAERCGDGKCRTVRADLIGDWNELSGVKADAVIMMDVLEHFDDDDAFLRKSSELLRPGGLLIVKVPAQKKLYSEMDRASGHFRRYDLSDLEELSRAINLQMTMVRKINPLGSLVYRFRNNQKKNLSKTFSPLQLRLINALMPIISIADYIPIVPGLSFIAVLEKPAS